MICLNETKFVWFKQNIFGPNKYLFESKKFLPCIKKIISLTIYQCINFFALKKHWFDSNKYLFGSKIFCLNQTNFISFKQIISLNQRNSFKQIIFFDSIKSFFSVHSYVFSVFHIFWLKQLNFRFSIVIFWIKKKNIHLMKKCCDSVNNFVS